MHFPLRAFRQAEQVVWMFPIGLGLQVFVATMSGYDYPNAFPVHADEELPLSALNPGNCVGLRQLPLLAVVVTAHILDALVGVVPVGFIDALNLIRLCHFLLSRPDGTGDAEVYY
jgi:hypothetical protein